MQIMIMANGRTDGRTDEDDEIRRDVELDEQNNRPTAPGGLESMTEEEG